MALVAALQQRGFVVERQRGIHIKLVRPIPAGRQVLIISNHQLLDTGTIRAIARQAGKHLTDEEVQNIFYAE